MTKLSLYSTLTLLLISNACSPSLSSSVTQTANEPTSVKKISRTGVVTFGAKKEIMEWKKALEMEIRRLVDSGHNNLDDIKNLANDNTQELEQPARAAYINQCLEIYRFSNKLALEATRERLDPEFEKSHQSLFVQVEEIMEDKNREACTKNFADRKNRLIEQCFQNANISQEKI